MQVSGSDGLVGAEIMTHVQPAGVSKESAPLVTSSLGPRSAGSEISSGHVMVNKTAKGGDCLLAETPLHGGTSTMLESWEHAAHRGGGGQPVQQRWWVELWPLNVSSWNHRLWPYLEQRSRGPEPSGAGGGGKDPPLEPPEGMQPCPHDDRGLLAPGLGGDRPCRHQPPACGPSVQQPRTPKGGRLSQLGKWVLPR